MFREPWWDLLAAAVGMTSGPSLGVTGGMEPVCPAAPGSVVPGRWKPAGNN